MEQDVPKVGPRRTAREVGRVISTPAARLYCRLRFLGGRNGKMKWRGSHVRPLVCEDPAFQGPQDVCPVFCGAGQNGTGPGGFYPEALIGPSGKSHPGTKKGESVRDASPFNRLSRPVQ